MSTDATCRVRIFVTDKEQGVSYFSVRYPFATSVEDAITAITLMIDRAEALINGAVVGWKLDYGGTVDDAPEPQPDSDTGVLLALIYRSEERYETLWIPSPSDELFETEGSYTAIRVRIDAPGLAPWLPDENDLTSHFATLEGEPWPGTFQVGGKAI